MGGRTTLARCQAAPLLLLVVVLFSLPLFTNAHSFLVCTHLQEDSPGQECTEESNFPYHEDIQQPNNMDYDHPEPGPLCKGRNDGYGMKTAKRAPIMKVGATTTLAWAADDHDIFHHYEIEDDGGFLGRYIYIFHSNRPDPDDSLFKTTPYAQLDYQNCDNKKGDYYISSSVDQGHICQGNLTISPELAPGLHTFVYAWSFFGVGENARNPIFDYTTCFQKVTYSVVNGTVLTLLSRIQVQNDVNPSPTIPVKGDLPAQNWKAVYNKPFAPMRGLQQTLNAVPHTRTRDNGKDTYLALWGPAAPAPDAPKPTSQGPKPTTSATAQTDGGQDDGGAGSASRTTSSSRFVAYNRPEYSDYLPDNSGGLDDSWMNTLTGAPSEGLPRGRPSNTAFLVHSSALPFSISSRLFYWSAAGLCALLSSFLV